MAKKILKVASFGLLGKKAASAIKGMTAATPAEQKGPIITKLGPGVIPPNRRQPTGPTILGGASKLGG